MFPVLLKCPNGKQTDAKICNVVAEKILTPSSEIILRVPSMDA